MVELNLEQRSVVRDILLEIIPGRKVMVFGSRATGRSKPHSDLDLVVMGDTPLPLRTMRQLKDAFDESRFPYQVDLVDWAATSDEFRKVILATAVDLD
jgi:type I restriction enzyme S subunit